MRKMKILISAILILAAQVNCFTPRRSLPATTPLPVAVEVPSRTIHGEKYKFIIRTSPNVTCHAGVAFLDTENNLVFDEFPAIEANIFGICEWNWEVPIQAQNGAAAFRGFVETSTQNTDFMPTTFCIEVEKCE